MTSTAGLRTSSGHQPTAVAAVDSLTGHSAASTTSRCSAGLELSLQPLSLCLLLEQPAAVRLQPCTSRCDVLSYETFTRYYTPCSAGTLLFSLFWSGLPYSASATHNSRASHNCIPAIIRQDRAVQPQFASLHTYSTVAVHC